MASYLLLETGDRLLLETGDGLLLEYSTPTLVSWLYYLRDWGLKVFKNMASQKITLFAFDASTGLPKSGDAANITAYVSKDDGSVTVLGDTSATELESTNAKGLYAFDLTQGETNADKLVFSAKSSTSNIVIAPVTIYTLPANFTAFSLDSSGRVDVIKIAGTSQTARDLGTSVLISSGTGTGQLSVTSGVIAANVTQFGGSAATTSGGRPEVNATHIAGSAVSTSAAQIGVNVVNAGGTAWGSGAITAAAIATDAIDADALAADAVDEIWAKAMTELAAVPGVTGTVLEALEWVFLLSRNKITETATTQTLRDNADSTSIGTSTVSDDGTTFTRGKWG